MKMKQTGLLLAMALMVGFGMTPHVSAQATLGEALDATNLVWTTGGNVPWGVQSTNTHDGILAASSGTITHSQETWLQTMVSGPGILYFWWKVSSEGCCDFMEFSTNGVSVKSIAGTVDWQQFSCALGLGNHTLRWRYRKDGAINTGEDKGCLDQVAYIIPNGAPIIVTQPLSQSRHRGESVTFQVDAMGASPITYQWWRDGVLLPGTTNTMLALTNLQAANIGNYWVTASNRYGGATSAVALLTVNLASLESGFNPRVEGQVYAMAVQADGKILVGGEFTQLAGLPHSYLGRLNADGTKDSSFLPEASSSVLSLAVQADGKILVGGYFYTLAGQTHRRIGRLNEDGTLDNTFSPGTSGSSYYSDSVSSLVVQADGKILVGGYFTNLAGQTRHHIARLHPDGTLDNTFNPGVGLGFISSTGVSSLAVQEDGKILVGGSFSTLAGQPRQNIGRLNPDGTLDNAFNPGADNKVSTLIVQADGKIMVGGFFSSLAGQNREYIGRLNEDGTVDSSFNPGADQAILSFVLQADGKIIAGGQFHTLAGQTRNYIGRLNSDGSLDSGFAPGASSTILSLALQADGKILAGGYFTYLAGQPCRYLARMHNMDAVQENQTFDSTTITWQRGGTSPEVWRTTFEVSSKGSAWIDLGEGKRVAGGWQLSGLTLPANATIRGRGYTASGYNNGSSGFLEYIFGAAWVASSPMSRTNNAGTTATFSTTVSGTAPFSYQWFKDGVPLTNGVKVAGAQTASLMVSNILGADAGGYSVAVANAIGGMTSRAAVLTVLDPSIASPPASQNRNLGENVTFQVTAVGTSPIACQWWKDGMIVPQATNTMLALANLQATDAGNYWVTMSNRYGCATSAFAMLTVNLTRLDSGFNPGANSSVYSLAMQANGKILIGGAFTNLAGQSRSYIGQLNADGTVDSGFNPGADWEVNTLAVQPDGKILVGGQFTQLAGQTRLHIGRLNPNGTVDEFNCRMSPSLHVLVLQSDGKILVGGSFYELAGQTHLYIGRINADGTVDSGFTPWAGYHVYSLALQTDGKCLVGGNFNNMAGQPCTNLGRLNVDGTLDSGLHAGAVGPVYSLVAQPDGKILVGGAFTNLAGQSRSYLGRLNVDGTVDSGFHGGAGGPVYSLVVQADGKILVGGAFTNLGGQPRSYLGRLNADGTVDNGFNPGANSAVYSLALQADGKILVGGAFTNLAGQSRANIGRLHNTDLAAESLTRDRTTITWLRGGSSPEVWRTTFEFTTNGSSWTSLGTGTRVFGGWQLDVLTQPTNATIRARGYTVGGYRNGSGGQVESFMGPILVTSSPSSRTNNAGTTATFAVTAIGTAPSYQWLKNGEPLTNCGSITGAQAATLTLSNVLGADAGNYSVMVVNASSGLTSQVAALTVVDPAITSQPTSQNRDLGGSVTFTATMEGTEPISCQWWKDGMLLSQAASRMLVLTNIRADDIGNYWVTASNRYGCATSTVASLMANLVSLDRSFNSRVVGSIHATVTQPDGKLLVGGSFTALAGETCTNLGRLNPDGTLDRRFNPGADGAIYALALQPDGKILASGSFSTLTGVACTNLGRLNADGTLDTGFKPKANGPVSSIVVQADGKILVGGAFSTLAGEPRNRIGRLNMDGTAEFEFYPEMNGTVSSLAMQSDGKILVGGTFTALAGYLRTNLGRLNLDGALDMDFNPKVDGSVTLVALQADGKILIGGNFTNLCGQPRKRIGRLHADGSLDAGFNPGADGGYYDPIFSSLVVQADGKILLGGSFTNLGGQPRSYIGRLNADGTLDNVFNPGANGINYSPVYVSSLAVQLDGKILVGGYFNRLAGQPCIGFGRLLNTDVATESLTFDGTTITWQRGGSSPEAWRTTFDVSTNGSGWVPLGAGNRINGGWQLSGLTLPANATIRARGSITSGRYNGSSGFVESSAGAALVNLPPASRTNNAGTTATFGVTALGTAPLSYQWLKDGVPLADGGNVIGAQTASLTASHVLAADAGNYRVVISNTAGIVTSQVAVLTVQDPTIDSQPTSQNRSLGESVTLEVTASGTAPLACQWWKDGALLPQATNMVLALSNLQATDAGNYWMTVSNRHGCLTSVVALLTVNAVRVDNGFNPGVIGWDYNPVKALAVQADGKILVGGSFSTLAGQPRMSLGRLSADGTLDHGFTPEANGVVYSIAMQADAKILVGGRFTTLAGKPCTNLGRLYPDGTLDQGFNPLGAGGTVYYNDYPVYALLVQADGKILVGGSFTKLAGQNRNYLGRLNADGTLDSGFNPGSSGSINTLAVQADGKILAGGYFTNLAGQPRRSLARLHADGTLDGGFNPGTQNGYVLVNSLVVQSDGKILIGGYFTNLAGQPRSCLGRLHADGTLDGRFNPEPNSTVHSLALQADGKILIGGYFTNLAGQSRSYLGRLHADGSLDSRFNPGASGTVYSLALQADGKILVGGDFTNLVGQSRSKLGRLDNTEPATDSLTSYSTTLTWLRGGTGPEVWRTTFEITTNGSDWLLLGAGSRVGGGWQLDGLTWPAHATIRARGYATGGYQNGSCELVESSLGDTLVSSSPTSRTNNAGTTATLAVAAMGTAPLRYQWLKDGAPLTDGGNIAGTQTATLTISSALGADAGGYHVVVTNLEGSATSQVAILTVLDPVITSQPVSQNRNVGGSVTLEATVVGSSPLVCQWWRNGAVLPQATNPVLVLTNLQAADAGNYWLTASNRYGCFTSSVALLTVNLVRLDNEFTPDANGSIYATVLQPDGKILVGGNFTTLAGQPCSNLGRLNADGTLDCGFSPGVAGEYNSCVFSLVIQPDGKILVGGNFTNLAGQSCTNLGRLHADGFLDSGFHSGAVGGSYNSGVYTLVVLPDGKILVGGNFTTLAGQACINLGRLDPDGILDSEFNPGASGDYSSGVYSLALQPSGKILVGGYFTTLAGQACSNLGCLNADGTLDSGFYAGANGWVSSLAVQADGKILVGGSFSTLAGQPRSYLGRLNADGTLDNGFNPGAFGYYSSVRSLVAQTDGKILVGGGFTNLAGQTRQFIGRLNADGTLDTTLNPMASGDEYASVFSLAVQTDGKILVGGYFTHLDGESRNGMGRLYNTGAATENLSFDNTTITWHRGGTSPEVWRTTFERSTNGFNWTSLGAGCRIDAGWKLDMLWLPTNATIRARGYSAGGRNNGSCGIVESIAGAALVTSPPVSQTNDAGTSATFSVTVVGTQPFHYQWLKNGTPLTHGGNIAGAQTALLTVDHVLMEDTAGYRVVISNSYGSVTSAMATLTVLVPPSLTEQPLSQTRATGMEAVFTVAARGLAPWYYQWFKDGSPLSNNGSISGSASAALTVSNLRLEDAGHYQVVVTNQVGSATSTVATLTVILPPAILEPPASQTVALGANVLFLPRLAGSEPLSYQWSFNGNPIAGANGPTLSLTSVQLTNAGQYSLSVSNAAGMASSPPATLTVVTKPLILASPVSRTNVIGSTAVFQVGAVGAPALRFHWRFNGAYMTAATNATLTLTNLAAGKAGSYSVVVSNAYGKATSAVATLTVVTPPAITAQPTNLTVKAGSNATFRVTATGTGPLTYRWLFNGSPLGGSVTNVLTLTGVQPTDAGAYRVVVSNFGGSVTSTPATLTVQVKPVILVAPASLHTNAGAVVQLSVLAEGTAPLSYRWRRNGTNLVNSGRVLGVTNATLVLTNLQFSEAGLYTVIVSNKVGAMTSAPPALLTLAAARLHSGAWSNGLFHFNLTGVTNRRLELQVCTNLPRPGQTSHWVTVQSLTNRAGTVLYQDPSPRQPHRFYRVVAP